MLLLLIVFLLTQTPEGRALDLCGTAISKFDDGEPTLAWRQFTRIEGGDQEYGPIHFIPPDEIVHLDYRQKAAGDQIRVDLKRHGGNLPVIAHTAPPTNAIIKGLSDAEIVRWWVDSTLPAEISESTRQMLAASALTKPDQVKTARAAYAKFLTRDADQLTRASSTLTNTGPETYFEFIPKGREKAVSARVLDIHPEKGSGVNILVEYPETDTELTRTRIVHQLTLDEVPSLDDSPAARERSRDSFRETLTPDGVEAVAQAKSLRLYGFTDFRRRPGGGGNALPALRVMSMIPIHRYVIQEYFEKTFGYPAELLHWLGNRAENILDVFGAIDPRYVFWHFGVRRGTGTEFMWVITEDGLLKISPVMQRNNRLRPPLYRLAGGRRVYAGGRMTLNTDGTVKLKLQAHYYQSSGEEDAGMAFRDGNPDLEPFIHSVFLRQGGVTVYSVDDHPIESFFTGSQREYYEYRAAEDAARNANGSQAGERPGPGQATSREKPSGRFAGVAAWDPKKSEIPLSLADWATKVGLPKNDRDPRMKMEWSVYVLRGTAQMSWREFKSSYKKLQKLYHPDVNPSAEAHDVSTRLADAYEFLDKMISSHDGS